MIDEIDRKLLDTLRHDARMSLKELAELQERGVIRGFTVDIDPAALGFTLLAIVRIRPLPGKLHIVQKLIQETPQIVECDKVTGDDCFIAGCMSARWMRSMQSSTISPTRPRPALRW